MQRPRVTIPLCVVALLLGGSLPTAARGRGTVLPELTGRSSATPAPRQRYREVRKRRERWLPSEQLPNGTIRFRAPGWMADVAPDGSVRFLPRRASWRASQTSLSYDVTEATQRSRGKHPYAAAQLRFLRTTRAWRAGLRRRARLRWRRQYFARLPGALRRLWARRDLSPAKKRQLLYRLWEECLEPGDSPLRRQAQQARWMVLRFIQRRLPAGSPQAYTTAELATFAKQRRGRPAFRPYQPLRRPLPPDVPRARPAVVKRARPPAVKRRPAASPPRKQTPPSSPRRPQGAR